MYGQTGGGKTHTITGDAERSEDGALAEQVGSLETGGELQGQGVAGRVAGAAGRLTGLRLPGCQAPDLPPAAPRTCCLPSCLQCGLTLRVFQQLFDRISQEEHDGVRYTVKCL